MIRFNQIVISFLIIIILCNCNSKNANSNNTDNTKTKKIIFRQDSIDNIENSIFPIYIDKNMDYEVKQFTFLQDIGKVEYIKLETNDSCLLRASDELIRVHLTDQEIFLSTGDNIFRFDKKGKFVNSIGKRGQGPWEIAQLSDFFVNEEKREVYLWDGATRNLKTYSFNGQPQNNIHIETYGDDIGAICDSSVILTNFMANNRPMAFLSSLKDGRTLKQILPVRTENDVTGLNIQFWDKYTNNILYNNKVIYQNFINDTIYTIDKMNFSASPRYIQLPANTGLDGKNSMPFIAFETDRYAYILISKRPPLDYNYIIDKKENKIYKGFIADLNRNTTIIAINSNIDNVIIDLYDISSLQDFLDKGYLKGDLKEITQTIRDEDNPILMIATIDF